MIDLSHAQAADRICAEHGRMMEVIFEAIRDTVCSELTWLHPDKCF